MHYPKVLERVDSPEQIFHRRFSLGAPECVGLVNLVDSLDHIYGKMPYKILVHTT